MVLDHRLDDEGGLGQGLGVGHDLNVLGIYIGAEPAERPLDGGARPLGRILRAGEQQHRTVVGRGGGEAAGDRAAADNCQMFVHLCLSSVFSALLSGLTDQSI